ncbi:MAG TPA: glycosyltransferase [Candidatus Moranbacteria bacterium]|nr:glycosyltransferase [Candidatus Moranbacteria bacterium]HSA08497.1 glycosyltransferase [Candidatus Moranbacteria bacterium]
MKIAIVTGIYNEERHIRELIDAVLQQTVKPDEFILVDDGSKDRTAEIVKEYAEQNPFIKYFYQKNAGPASARNRAWKNSTSEICIFTDGDCVPNSDWIEKLIGPFSDENVGAVAGTYRTVNTQSILARFIGLEIGWKHSRYGKTIDVHGTYNLAVRKSILEEIGGLDESYPVPSGEDWDMTYKISKICKIAFVPEAIVGHYHPEKFLPYMKNQVRRGLDRVKVYKDHPNLIKGDSYTPWFVKYQVLAAGFFPISLLFLFPLFKFSYILPLAVILFLIVSSLPPFVYFFKKDKPAAFFSIPIQIARNFAWVWGMVKGIMKI